MNKALCNYTAAFGFFDKTLLVLLATSVTVSIVPLATAVFSPGWITSASLIV